MTAPESIPYEVVAEAGHGWVSYRWRATFPDGSVFLSASFPTYQGADAHAQGWCCPPSDSQRKWLKSLAFSPCGKGGPR